MRRSEKSLISMCSGSMWKPSDTSFIVGGEFKKTRQSVTSFQFFLNYWALMI